MRLRTIQVIAALIAAVAFVLAFMAAGVVLVSSLFMAVGLAAIAWLAWSLVRRVKLWGDIQEIRARRRKPAA
jgi:threonine/homoserine/homoserine lactone efflux protein